MLCITFPVHGLFVQAPCAKGCLLQRSGRYRMYQLMPIDPGDSSAAGATQAPELLLIFRTALIADFSEPHC